jgi:hypothetical protein
MSSSIIIDSNLLTLFVIGTASRNFIATHKRASPYTAKDYDLLVKILGGALEILVTPHALAETSNLIGYTKEPDRAKIYETMRRITSGLTECPVVSSKSMERTEFLRLGLTDCTLLDINHQAKILLTADLNLYLAATKVGYEAYNFHHLRDM